MSNQQIIQISLVFHHEVSIRGHFYGMQLSKSIISDAGSSRQVISNSKGLVDFLFHFACKNTFQQIVFKYKACENLTPKLPLSFIKRGFQARLTVFKSSGANYYRFIGNTQKFKGKDDRRKEKPQVWILFKNRA